MLKVTLRYTDLMLDGKKVFKTLSQHGAIILKTKFNCINPKVTILIDNINSLNSLLSDLNTECVYGVEVIKTKAVKENTK